MLKVFRLPLILLFLVAGASEVSADLTLREALAELGGTIRYNPLLSQCSIGAGGHEAVFSIGERGAKSSVLFDSARVLKLDSPYTENGALLFPASFVSRMGELFNKAMTEDKSRYRIAAIIVDPGHGGKDGGAQGTHTIDGKKVTVTEKDVVLKVSLELFDKLRKAYPDKKILMTRNSDTFPSLNDRTVIANSVPLAENEAIIYISVHANSSFNKDARGYEVWYLTPEYRRSLITDKETPASLRSIQNVMLEEEYTKESIMMAQSVVDGFRAEFPASFPSRGVRSEEWYVVRNSKMPAILVELGFVSNAEDAKLLSNQASLSKFALAIFNGIRSFVLRFEETGGFTH